MPQREKLKGEEKILLVRRYLEGEIGFSNAIAQACVGKVTFRRWVKRYQAEGAAGFLPYKHNRAYSEELKMEAVCAYLSGDGSVSSRPRKSLCNRQALTV